MTFPKHIHTFHSGQPQPDTSAHTFPSIDPSTAEPLATVYTTTPTQLSAAIASARTAFPLWSATPPAVRSAVLLRAAALLRQRNDALALTETLDTGKALAETTVVDVATGADVLEYYAHMIASGGGGDGRHVRLRDDAYVLTTREPVGVCAAIGAWNYPLQIALWKSAPCLAAGNCMVYKPSEVTPLHAGALARIYLEAGLPPGVFNVVYGDGPAVGAPLVAHPDIAKVSFTGQVSTGSRVAAAAAADLKAVTMELGGKSALLILPGADVDDAADVAMAANFFSSGQVCTNGTRVFVPDDGGSFRARFERALVDRCRTRLRMGDPRDPATNFGPVVSAAHRDKVRDYIRHGKDVDGATVLYDGGGERGAQSRRPTPRGYWVPPVIFTDCADGMRVAREEIFGPVMCILPYRLDLDDRPSGEDGSGGGDAPWLVELLRRANGTDLGLAAGVVASDVGLAHGVARRLDAGIVWVNTWGESPAEMPVGGWKRSGLGVENGVEGLEAYTRIKSTLVQLGRGACREVFAKL